MQDVHRTPENTMFDVKSQCPIKTCLTDNTTQE